MERWVLRLAHMTSPLTLEAAWNALRGVNDPELHQSLVALGMVERLEVEGTLVDVKINLTTPACPLKGQIEREVKAALEGAGALQVKLEFGAIVRASSKGTLPGVKNIIVVGSGKGGVGKSSVATNLAVSLASSGAAVGLLDADIYGPSVAHMMGMADSRIKANADKKMMPLERFGLKFVSMANLAAQGQALVWRGPMLHSAVKQFLSDVAWGELDYLIVDLPPGTGDVQLSLANSADITGAVIVTTPQDVALIDAARAIDMFRKNQIPILGLIENMSHFVAPDTGVRYDIFGTGGGQRQALEHKLFFLGQIPLDIPTREAGDAGVPVVLASPQSAAAVALESVAKTLAGRISVQSLASLPMV